MSDIFQAEAQVQSIRTLVDGSIKLDVVTQSLPPEELAKLFGLRGKLGWFVLKEGEIQKEDIPTEELTLESSYKKPSQRLRGTLWHVWDQTTNHSEDFDTQYYPRIMNELVERYKEKLS